MCLWAWFLGRRLRKWWVSENFWKFLKNWFLFSKANCLNKCKKMEKTTQLLQSQPYQLKKTFVFLQLNRLRFLMTRLNSISEIRQNRKSLLIRFDCLVCPEGFYGDCSMSCTCQNGATCERVNGTCTCTAGYVGMNCELECPEWKHGMNCELDCSCVRSNTQSCDHTNGQCLCQSGYKVKDRQISERFALEI